jgi:sodium-dependent dicarboxylate transporter 2/3/5
LFVIPAKNDRTRIMNWRTARGLPWGIVLLFGGGFALAEAFKVSGLSQWLGGQLSGLHGLPVVVIVVLVCLMITFLTELTSNTATTQMILPILGSMALAIEVNPLLLMIPATLSASCAFMLPVATPPNAIIFGTERIGMASLARTGLFLNIVGALIVTLAIFLIGRVVFGIDLNSFPGWAAP